MGSSRVRLALCLLALLCLVGSLTGCRASSSVVGPHAKTIVFAPPSLAYARGLGITEGPITVDQAKAIAAAAAGGVATSVEQEDQDGTQVFGVLVAAGSASKDVKVRIGDGAVTQIDDASGGDGEGGDGD